MSFYSVTALWLFLKMNSFTLYLSKCRDLLSVDLRVEREGRSPQAPFFTHHKITMAHFKRRGSLNYLALLWSRTVSLYFRSEKYDTRGKLLNTVTRVLIHYRHFKWHSTIKCKSENVLSLKNTTETSRHVYDKLSSLKTSSRRGRHWPKDQKPTHMIHDHKNLYSSGWLHST